MKYICKKSSNQEMFVISLSSSCRYNANFKFDQSVLFMTVRHIFEISEDDRPPKHAQWPTPAIIDELKTSLMLSFPRG
jgi:hypothetical protein